MPQFLSQIMVADELSDTLNEYVIRLAYKAGYTLYHHVLAAWNIGYYGW
jgi:hypothetical protein